MASVLGSLGLCGIVLVAAADSARAQKTDLLVMDNGDHLTVEVKQMTRGKLTVKTHGLGTLEIQWPRVARLVSDKVFRFEVASGLDWFGSLIESDKDGELLVQREQGTLRLSMERVIAITPIEDSFVDRINGHVDLGLNYSRATEITQFNFGFGVKYDARKLSVSANGSSIINRQSQIETKRRNELGVSARYFWQPQWFVQGGGGLQQNDELGLVLRSYAFGTLGRPIYRDESSSLNVLAGLLVSHEEATGSQGASENLEGVLRLEYEVFSFKDPDLDISANASGYPSFSVSGRFRSEVNLRVAWEIISDLKWNLTFYANTDNRPPDVNAEKSDYGIISGMTYTF